MVSLSIVENSGQNYSLPGHGDIALAFLVGSMVGLGVETVNNVSRKIFDTKDIVDVLAGRVVAGGASSSRDFTDTFPVFVRFDHVVERGEKMRRIASFGRFAGDVCGGVQISPLLLTKIINW